MKAENFFEDWKDTLGTSTRNAVSQYANTKLAKMGSAAAGARVGLRNDTNSLVNGWLAWMARHNFGPNKRVGDADDLREYLRLAYGQQTLDQLEPTIAKLVPTTPTVPTVAAPTAAQPTAAAPATQPAAQPAAPAPAPATQPAAAPAQPAAQPVAQPGVNPMDPAEQRRRRLAARHVNIPASPAGATHKRTATPHQVPNFLSRQRNQESVKYDLLSRIVETMEQAAPEQRARLMSMSQRLQEAGPALNRSVIDQVMRQLAIDQYNTKAYQQQKGAAPQQVQGSPQGQPGRNAAPQQAQQQPQQQASAPRIDPDQIMHSQVTLNGLTKALNTRRVALSVRDQNAITSALQNNNGTMTLDDLVTDIHTIDATALPAILFAMAYS